MEASFLLHIGGSWVSPPTQPPCIFGVLLGATSGGGIFWVPTLPSPLFAGGEEGRGIPAVPAGRAPGAFPAPCRSSELRCSLPCPSRFPEPGAPPAGFATPGEAGRARRGECHYGEQTKPGILLPRGENRKETKAGFAECLKTQMTLPSRGLGLLSLDVITNSKKCCISLLWD